MKEWKMIVIIVLAVFLAASVVGGLLRIGEKNAQITQLQAEKKQWDEVLMPELEQLRADKQQWEEIDKPALEKVIAELKNLRVLAPSPKDPTYSALMDFVAQDETNLLILPGFGKYGMVFFARAQEVGIKAYLARVTIVGPPQQYWYFTAFNTTDKGLVYIFPYMGIEGVVKLEVGKKYEALNEYPFVFGLNDTILKIELFE
jgi:hypothetical protein